MTDELHVRRRQQLQEAVRRAIVDLFAHERPEEEFSFPLDSTKRVWVTVKIGAAPTETS
jgi:hemerythrin superfamily protein